MNQESRPEPVSPEIRTILEQVLLTHRGKVSAHFGGCWHYHAGCLAALLMGVIEDE